MSNSERPEWVSAFLRPGWRWVAVAAAVALLFGAYLMYFTHSKRAVRNRLSEADTKSKAAIDQRIKPLTQLFAKGRKGAPAFAKESLSWSGKWALVKGLVAKDTHREFLAEAFARHVISPDELRGAIEGVCRAYADDLEGFESEMLVLLRADLADPDRPAEELSLHLRSNEGFKVEYRKLSERLIGETRSDLAVSVGREVVVLVAAEAGSRAALQAARAAATEMGAHAGILGAGASSTVATLGIGLVIGFIIDALLDELFKMAGYDAEAKIAEEVIESIDRLEASLVRDPGVWRHLGISKKGALRVELEKLHESRSKLRRDAVELMMKEGGLK
jgi:hypothetical protein